MNTILILLLPLGYFIFVCIRIILQKKRAARQKRELARAYNGFVIRERMIIDHSEVVGNMVIALNRSWKELLLIDHHGKEKKTLRIRLTTVVDCLVKEERHDRGHLKFIQLLLYIRSQTDPVSIFFRPAEDSLAEEQTVLKIARRWKNLVDIHKYVAKSV